MFLLQPQCYSNLIPQSLYIAFYLPYVGLVQITTALGVMVYWQFLGGCTVDVVG